MAFFEAFLEFNMLRLTVLPSICKILLAITLPALSGCWVKKTTCRGLHNQMPGACAEYTRSGDQAGAVTDEQGAVISGEQPGAESDYVPTHPNETVTVQLGGPGFGLTRVTPEQLSNNIVAALNYGAEPNELRWNDDHSGQTHDYLQLLFGVALGGVDFETAAIRDPTTKAQTLLVSRVIAIQLAGAGIWKDWQKPAGSRVIFNKCDMSADRPFRSSDNELPAAAQADVRAGEERWTTQVEELFYRFYSRPPTAPEIAAVKTAFNEGMDAEGYPLAGWIPVVYALMASQEFWHQ
jgi:hypothetical protein